MSATDPVQAVARAIAKASWSSHRLPADSACNHCMEAWELAEVAVEAARPIITAEALRAAADDLASETYDPRGGLSEAFCRGRRRVLGRLRSRADDMGADR